MTAPTDRLLHFYCGSGTGMHGRAFDDILRFEDAQLERLHDYIQWLFPTVSASRFSPDAPTLDRASALKLRSDPVAQQRLHAALVRILAFYGLELDDSDPEYPEVLPAKDFDARARSWLTKGNHNYRRLTRILESLCVLNQRTTALALFRRLDNLYRTGYEARIGQQTLAHWSRQVE